MAKDVTMFYIDDDIKKIQTKTNLYLQHYGPEGAFHLSREIIQNNIDEIIDPESNGSTITITYDIETDKLTCEDDGRGFPEKDYPLDIFCTKNQSGSKFFRDQGGDSSGEFGVGLTVVNALSDEFTLGSYREDEKYKHFISFNEGEKKSDKRDRLNSNDKKHGSFVSFIPSKKYLGKNTHIPYKDMLEWIDKMTYFIRKKKVKINVEIYEGFKLLESYKFKPKPFEELLDRITIDNTFSPKCNFNGDSYIEEKVRKSVIDKKTGKVKSYEEDVIKHIHLDVALRYSPESITFWDTYCNYTNTTDGGVHQDTVERCFCNYMQNKTKATMTDNQKEKTPILWNDVREGLCCVVNLSTNAQVGFVGNAKSKIGSEALIPYLTEIINKGLDDFFNNNSNALNEYIKIIRLNAKARVEASKIKVATQKERMNSFKEHEMGNFISCTNKGKAWKEIYLVEGDSPAGSARNGCDTKTQAFMMFRGNTANAFKKTLSELMDPKTGNKEWIDYVNVLRCGIGPSFDINKLYFNRINIYTDQDIDGFGISSGMLGFHYKYLPEIIKAGKLFKVFTPLYSLEPETRNGELTFVANKTEMVELYHKKISKNYKIKFEEESKYSSKNDLKDFLRETYEYRENLIRISEDMGNVNKFLVEAIIAFMVLADTMNENTTNEELDEIFKNQKFIKYLASHIQKKFKEVTVKENRTISGVVDGKYCLIKLSNRFIRKSVDLIKVVRQYGYELTVQEKNNEEKVMSIGEFLDDATKYLPKIKERFKGLGELDGEDLFKTSLDINNRVSVQYTMESAKRELDLFNIVHGPSKKDAELRKEMMKKYKIKRDDLDN